MDLRFDPPRLCVDGSGMNSVVLGVTCCRKGVGCWKVLPVIGLEGVGCWKVLGFMRIIVLSNYQKCPLPLILPTQKVNVLNSHKPEKEI